MADSKKTLKDDELKSKIQEIDLDTLGAAMKNLTAQDEKLQQEEAEQAAKEIESWAWEDDAVEALEEIWALKKEKGLKRMPIERDMDKRRVWKGLTKFIDNEVPDEVLEDMSEEVQELMKKWKIDGRITQDELMNAVPNAEDDVDLLDEIYSRFMSIWVDVVDSLDKANLFESEKKTPKKDNQNGAISLSEISDDSIRMYLNEIGRVDLLTWEQEVELGWRIKAWDQEARKALAAANLRLVVSIAKKYMGRAIADQARTIRVPVHMIETINKFTHTYRRLTQELTREPLMEELATELDMDIKKVRQIMRISQDILSLDAPVGSEEDTSLGDFIEDDKTLAPDEQTNMNLLKDNLNEMLDFLTPRERKIIKMRFGLEWGDVHTLEEVWKEFWVTRERIRQIEAKTLEKLKEHPNADKIKFF